MLEAVSRFFPGRTGVSTACRYSWLFKLIGRSRTESSAACSGKEMADRCADAMLAFLLANLKLPPPVRNLIMSQLEARWGAGVLQGDTYYELPSLSPRQAFAKVGTRESEGCIVGRSNVAKSVGLLFSRPLKGAAAGPGYSLLQDFAPEHVGVVADGGKVAQAQG
jgi:hypothetical protein